jgi:hypothetical protein
MELSGKNKIVADGLRRFNRGKKTVTSKSIEQKYAKELASATPAEKTEIHKRMAEDLLRHGKMLNHKPSAGSLW